MTNACITERFADRFGLLTPAAQTYIEGIMKSLEFAQTLYEENKVPAVAQIEAAS